MNEILLRAIPYRWAKQVIIIRVQFCPPGVCDKDLKTISGIIDVKLNIYIIKNPFAGGGVKPSPDYI